MISRISSYNLKTQKVEMNEGTMQRVIYSLVLDGKIVHDALL